MNILITDFYGGMAGSTMSASYLAKGLAKRGHHICIACSKGALLETLFQAEDKVKVFPLEIKGKLDFKAAKALQKIVEEEKIDLIDVQASKDRYIAAWSKWFYGVKIPIVYTRRQDPKSSLGALQRKFYVKSTEKIIVISQGLKEIFVRKGYPENHLHIIHNGIPEKRFEQWSEKQMQEFRSQFGLTEKDIVIGSVSRMKEQDQIIRAVKLLNRPEIKLLFAGIDKGSLDAIIQEVDLTNEVIYAGMVPNEKVLNIYRLLDLNILASTMDGFGLVLVEAMAMGCPVIGTRFGGIKDVIQNEKNGFLFENNNIEELADKIRQVIEDKALKNRFIEAGKQTAFNEFTIDKTVEKHEAFFEGLIG